MKNIFFIFAILILSTSMFAQISYVDTLQNGQTPKDTVFIQDLGKQSPMVNVTLENLGAAACTLQVRGGSFTKDANDYVKDTTWYYVPLRDSSWTIVTSIILPVNSSRTYWVQKPDLEAIKTWVTNTTGGNVRVFYEGTKPED
jgi:hypothetical protein